MAALRCGLPVDLPFSEGTKGVRHHLDEDSFVAKYPFVDYQFEMFTQAM